MQTVNLDALEHTEHTVVVHGTKYPVRQNTPRIANILDAAVRLDPAERVSAYYDGVQQLVPSMPREVLDDLNWRQVLKIVAIANTAVRAVDEAAASPNAPSSADPVPAAEPETGTPLVAC